MKLFFAYLSMHRKTFILFVLFCVIFAVIFWLHRIPLAAVAYAAALCGFIGLVYRAVDFGRFVQKHQQLRQVLAEISVHTEHLPQADSLLEQDYQELLDASQLEKRKLANQMTQSYHDLVDYYTIWAHQIKTPIAAMRLRLQGEESDANRVLLEELQRIEQYVEMVLTYLRLDADSTDYVFHHYELDTLIKQAIRKFAPSFIRKKIKLCYEPLHCTVLTDEKWLSFVLEQVLSNALKYTPNGSISITLEEGKTLCIRDTGIGIAPADLPRIFENGFTGYNGRTDKKASGIGLYLCRRICQNLGHHIEARSDETGTVIRIRLEQASLQVE